MSETNQAYISRVHLKGYKSIRDMDIDLLPGLNIIIGPNGSGKTNFVKNFLADVVNEINEDFLRIITYKNHNNKNTFTESSQGINTFEGNAVQFILENKFYSNNNLIEESRHTYNSKLNTYETIYKGTSRRDFYNNSTFILFESSFASSLQNDLNLQLSSFNNSNQFHLQFKFPQPHYLIEAMLKTLFNISEIGKSEKDIDRYFEINNNLKEQLNYFTPIKDLQVNTESCKSYYVDAKRNIDNAYLQYKINEKWLNWNQLSDGSKRMFYIITSILLEKSKIVFIEEPELGIHPHQLSLLMDFFREQSRYKQIIITTHSPQVLNELREDELDRIIVTRHEGERGTQMYHLSEEEKGFAKGYMENGAFLSDYWVQSGFMNEEEIV